MATARWKDPLLLGYVALGIVLLPTIVLLAEVYPSYNQRMRQAAGPPRLAPIPELPAVRGQAEAAVPDVAGCDWQPVYAPEDEPRTGVARVLDLSRGAALAYRYLILRHDIACGTCRDLLFGALYEVETRSWRQIVLLEPLERESGAVDATAFLEQFRGRPVAERLVVGDNIDGLTGATKSVQGLIHRLNDATRWLEQQPAVPGSQIQSREARL